MFTSLFTSTELELGASSIIVHPDQWGKVRDAKTEDPPACLRTPPAGLLSEGTAGPPPRSCPLLLTAGHLAFRNTAIILHSHSPSALPWPHLHT
ncbi:uncharacterized [Tachysurus ichikawai]